ncbi:hypothetical protein THF5G08_230036 [Vibrio jasicida]|nr:hypothetical protein THF5G08_230036 [Vibrio jasicida]
MECLWICKPEEVFEALNQFSKDYQLINEDNIKLAQMEGENKLTNKEINIFQGYSLIEDMLETSEIII